MVMLEGPAVLMIQKVLAGLGYKKLILDGVLGPQTWAAIKALGNNAALFGKAIKLVNDKLKKKRKTTDYPEDAGNLLKQILETSDADEAKKLIERYYAYQTNQNTNRSTKTRVAKEEKPETATSTVLKLINRSKGGITTKALSKETGFDSKKITNIIYRLKKQNKIKSLGRGIYGAR
ncbi:MAG: peptidoglycan-binding domain-containing protein [Desulfobacterales bacterium]|nr:peptidoglycan-binding domain-containing protein [Desulfobacterales bacterium]